MLIEFSQLLRLLQAVTLILLQPTLSRDVVLRRSPLVQLRLPRHHVVNLFRNLGSIELNDYGVLGRRQRLLNQGCLRPLLPDLLHAVNRLSLKKHA